MKKTNAILIQLNGEAITPISGSTTRYTLCFVLPEKGSKKLVFETTDDDVHDKYLFRDLDFLTTLGSDFFELCSQYNFVSSFQVDNYLLQLKNDFFCLDTAVLDNLTYDNYLSYFKMN